MPALAVAISIFGAPEGFGSLRQARALTQKLINQKENDPWKLPYVHAAVCTWWLAEYSGWYLDNPIGSPLVGVDLEEGMSKVASM
jgi:nuclear pore complex protein Nup205